MDILNIILVVVAYLLGSIPSAVWIGKRFYGVDVREHGSKNAGATNTLRVLGKKAALPVFIIDFLKGFAAVELSLFVPEEYRFIMQILLAVAAVMGHIFPLYAGFRGGKGVATIAGAVLAITPLALLLSLVTFFIVLFLSKYVSLGSIIAAVAYPVYVALLYGGKGYIIFGIVISVALIITHRKNIKRLIQGTESKTYLIRKKTDK